MGKTQTSNEEITGSIHNVKLIGVGGEKTPFIRYDVSCHPCGYGESLNQIARNYGSISFKCPSCKREYKRTYTLDVRIGGLERFSTVEEIVSLANHLK
jgi:hypothetical protein